MTGAEIMAVVGFMVMLAGAGWRVWARVEDKVKVAEGKAEKVQERADKVASDLADFKLRVAETYATKTGMQEQTAQIMRAIESVANRIDGLTERIDSIMASRTPRSRP